MTRMLKLICVDLDAPPLFSKSTDGITREGYEPEAASLVASELGRIVTWVFKPWAEMIPALQAGEGDGIWCGQGITEDRLRLVDFTRPYAVFNESVLVRAGSGITGPGDLRGIRVAAIAGSTNLALAETFDGAKTVPFDGASDDVFGDMVVALRDGDIDAVVDDDVALVPLADAIDLEIAFTVATRNQWGVAVAKDRPDLRHEFDTAIERVTGDGRLEQVWRRWMPTLDYPFQGQA